MRYITKFAVVILLLTLTTVSCKKDLTLEPIFFQPTTFTTSSQLVNQLAYVYNALQQDNTYAQGYFGYLEAGADESFRTDAATTKTGIFELYNTNFSSTEQTISRNWRSLYVGIEAANVLLDVVNKPVMDETLRSQIKGQALFLRAYYFFLLVSRYGDIPLKTMLTTSMGTNFYLARTPKKEVYNFILKDMMTADGLVQTMPKAQNTLSVTSSAVEAVLARVCLTMAGNPVNDVSKYKDALFWAQKVINSGYHSLNSAPLSLYPNTPAYAKVFINNMQNNVNDNNISEGIWDAAFLSKSNNTGTYANSGFLANQTLGASTYGIYCPDASASGPIGYSNGTYRAYNKLYRLYGAGDQRRDWAIAPYSYKNTSTTQYNYLSVIFTGGGGTGAAATAFVSNTGAITSIQVDNPGSGYTTAPTISFSSYINSTVNLPAVPPQSVTSSASIATATATVSGGKVTAINVVKPGLGYPTVYERCVGKWRREYEVGLSGVTRLQNFSSSNFPIIRYADVLLMAAEADLNINGTPGTPSAVAVGYYNQVRRRAYGFSPTTVVPTLDVSTFTMQDIMDERSRELCFEGVRRQDLIRWGQLSNAMQAILDDNNIYAPTTYTARVNLAPSNFLATPSKFLLLPIPSSELGLDLALTQNPNW